MEDRVMTTTRITKLSFTVFFAALAIAFIAGLSLLTPTVTYEAELEGRENACPAGGELQGGQCVVEPQPTGGCEGQGFTMNEEGQCVNRPGRSDLHTER
jgi:hypothetical protein